MKIRQVVLMLLAALSLLMAPREMPGQKEQAIVLIPGKTKLSLELLSPLSTATSKKGDKFSCKVLSPAELVGATVSGYVRHVKRSGKVEGKSEIELGFESITLTDGRVGSFNASVTEVFDVVDAAGQGQADKEGTVKAKSTVKRDMLKIGVGAAVGAVIGVILGGAQGAAIGAAIGAGVGVTTNIATKGPDLEFKQGTQFTVVMNSPSRQQKATKQPVEITKTETPEAPVIRPPAAQGETRGSEVTVNGKAAKTAETKPVVLPSLVTSPRPPSERYRLYTGNGMFQLSVPANWRESSSSNPVTFAPDGGRLLSQDKFVLTHGAMTGVSQSTEKDLVKATEQFTSALLQNGRSYVSRQGECQSSSLSGKSALSCSFSGVSNITGRMEKMAVYTALLNDGGLYYLIFVVPADELPKYQTAFQSIRSSVRFNVK